MQRLCFSVLWGAWTRTRRILYTL